MKSNLLNISLSTTLLLLVGITNINAQIPCESGMSNGIYPCDNVDFYARVTADELFAVNTGGVWLNDIWGWTDPDTGKEYALVGLSNGTTFVDVSDPLSPLVLGILPEHHSASGRGTQGNSLWRDVKVYKNYAFIVSEDNNHGMQVFDLTQLRNVSSPPETFSESAHYDGIGKAHNIVINEETGFAYAVGAQSGTQCNGGGLHIIDINDPLNPTFAGCFDDDGYSHDAQVVIYNGPDTDYTGQEICFGSNEDKISISNVTDKSNTFSITTQSYSGAEYTHQGWLSEDHRYFYCGDELDELNNGGKTKTFVWDVSDLDNPTLVSTFSHINSTIDHNLYVKDTLIYASNYTSGLRILNTKNVATTGLKEVAFFDTFHQNNNTSFDGTWSNYPYFESGIIIVSDIVNGLFILKYNPSEEEIIATINKDELNAVNIFPNPFSDKIYIDNLSVKSDITVFNISGIAILELIDFNGSELDLSELNKGLYIVKITNTESSHTLRVLKR